jgi:menaquinone-dependent protoporphyrinogen oxidase
MKVLIAYATTEGQTRKIAEKVANQVRELGHVAELVDVDRGRHNINVDDFNAVIVAASVHQHDHQDAIEVFVDASPRGPQHQAHHVPVREPVRRI